MRRRPLKVTRQPPAYGWTVLLTMLTLVVLGWLAVIQLVVERFDLPVSWLGVAPLVASLVLRAARTALAGLAAVSLAIALVLARPAAFDAGDAVAVLTVLAMSVFGLANAVIRQHREVRLVRLGEIGQVLQASLLRPLPAVTSTARFAARYRSADPDVGVGGDLLEVVDTLGGARVLVADVRGRGLEAIAMATTVRSVFREVGYRDEIPLADVARLIDRRVAREGGAEDFVTALFLQFDRNGWLEVVNCGHPAPLRLVPGRRPERLGTVASPPLGLGVRPTVERYILATGDRILAYTDGLVEARGADGAFFPLDEHCAPLAEDDPELALAFLVEAVDAHAGGLSDDVAVLLASVEPTTAPVPAQFMVGGDPSGPRRSDGRRPA